MCETANCLSGEELCKRMGLQGIQGNRVGQPHTVICWSLTNSLTFTSREEEGWIQEVYSQREPQFRLKTTLMEEKSLVGARTTLMRVVQQSSDE